MKMTSFRAKPVGWVGESHRHYLAAKGVKTRYYSVGPNIDASKDKQKYFAGSASYDKKHPNPFVTNEMVETEIESGSTLAHDVAANMGQDFDNVKHTAVFKKRVAEALRTGNID